MKEIQKTYLLGMSGHALSVIDALNSFNEELAGYFNASENKNTDITFLGQESVENCAKHMRPTDVLFPAVGSNDLRKKMLAFIDTTYYGQRTIVHSKAIVSPTAQIGKSTLVSAGAIVNASVNIGKGAIINSGAIIEHECQISDFVHIGPGAVLAGNVKVGSLTFIGANATVKQGVTIGENTVVGAGSVVLEDIPDNVIFVGNPAKFLKANA